MKHITKDIYNMQEAWPAMLTEISICKTISTLAKEHNGKIPLSLIKTRLHGRITWTDMDHRLAAILKKIGGKISTVKNKGRGRKKSIVVIPEKWWNEKGTEQE